MSSRLARRAQVKPAGAGGLPKGHARQFCDSRFPVARTDGGPRRETPAAITVPARLGPCLLLEGITPQGAALTGLLLLRPNGSFLGRR